ncbi:hypothetical protein, partial [Coprococcus eutactus]|uniref:hypothetical protein n=1 Tax=Coprococcus eutactus TaxID=33043 RepID=UPI001A9A40A0
QPLWDVRIRTRMIQFNTHHFKLITITHKNALLTGCPVKRVHISELSAHVVFMYVELYGFTSRTSFARSSTLVASVSRTVHSTGSPAHLPNFIMSPFL